MKVYVTNGYMVMIALFGLASVVSIAAGLWLWLSVALVMMLVQTLGHEWAHVLVAKVEGMDIKRICLDWRGGSYAVMSEAKPGPEKNLKEANAFFAGVVWDMYCYGIMIVMMIGSSIRGDYVAPFVAAAMMIVFWFSLKLPGSDWHQYLEKRDTPDVS